LFVKVGLVDPVDFEKKVLAESYTRDVLIVFLRHFGCLFTLKLLEKLREFLDKTKDAFKVYCIHPGQELETSKILALLRTANSVEVISDFERALYKHFKVRRGSFLNFLTSVKDLPISLGSFIKAAQHFSLTADVFQLPTAILVKKGAFYKHESNNLADLPPLQKLLCLSHVNDF
jgi:hypothetical protein